ncbi:MAG TPA: hypothetical protein VFW87_03540 [Pirellulales bacterium]|nr:hypothetical protein [Pirellulales bacterium]
MAGIARHGRAASTALIVAAVLAILVTATDAWACPMCKAALGSSGRNHGDWVGGFFWSILFMLSMPFLILGGLSAYMYSLVRQERRTAEQHDKTLPGDRRKAEEPMRVS